MSVLIGIAILIAVGVISHLCNKEREQEEREKQKTFKKQEQLNAAMSVIESEELPADVTIQLLPKENVYYFSYISFKGGCMSSESLTDHWICLSDKRILYKSKVIEDNETKLTQKNGVIPFEKISFMEIISTEETGCGSSEVSYGLRIGSSGGSIMIPIPTEMKGFEIRKTYMGLSEHLKNIGSTNENN